MVWHFTALVTVANKWAQIPTLKENQSLESARAGKSSQILIAEFAGCCTELTIFSQGQSFFYVYIESANPINPKGPTPKTPNHHKWAKVSKNYNE